MTRATGRAAFVSLVLRLERRHVAIWALAAGGLTAVVGVAFDRLYPTAASRRALRTLADAPTLRAILGPLSDPRTTGGLVAWREGLLLAVGLSLATTFLVVRRTRAEEQRGRAELLLSTPVGRATPVATALLAAAVLDVAGAGAITVALLALSQGVASSLLFGAVVGLVAWWFGAVAALWAQFASTSRAANGGASGTVAGAYLLGALGNLSWSWLVWLTPLGWVQEARPYGAPRALVLLLPLCLGALAAGLAGVLATQRDVGRGLRGERVRASRALAPSVRGLAWRTQRVAIRSTLLVGLAYGVCVGGLVAQFGHLLRGSPVLEQSIERLGGTRALGDAFTTAMAVFGAIAIGAWVVSMVLRVHSEESHGHVALLAASGSSRRSVLDGYAVTALGAGVTATLLWGLGIGIGRSLADHHASSLASGTVAGIVAVPSMLVVAALALVAVGASRRTAPLAWVGVAWCGIVAVVGTFLGLPSWVLDLSPFHHVPALPLHGTWWLACLVLLGVAAALGEAGRVGFSRRELGSS